MYFPKRLYSLFYFSLSQPIHSSQLSSSSNEFLSNIVHYVSLILHPSFRSVHSLLLAFRSLDPRLSISLFSRVPSFLCLTVSTSLQHIPPSHTCMGPCKARLSAYHQVVVVTSSLVLTLSFLV